MLTETPGGLAKKYAGKEKNVPFQMARSADALHRPLRKACGEQATFVDSLLYCPDYTVKEPGTAGIDPARIVDAAKKDYLMYIIRAILPESGEVLSAKEKIHRFLGDILQLVPQADAVVGAAQTLYTRLSGSLLSGSGVGIVSYSGTADLIAKTLGAVTDCIRAGFKRQHIAVISYRGREHSKFAPLDKLGPYALRAPTGR